MYTNKKRSENDQYNETSNHIQMKGYGGGGGVPPRPPGSQPRRRRPLSFVYGLMSHCIDRFRFVFYLYTFHFMLPMCIWLIFVVIYTLSSHFFKTLLLRVASALRGLLENKYWIWLFPKGKKLEKIEKLFFLECFYEAGKNICYRSRHLKKIRPGISF